MSKKAAQLYNLDFETCDTYAAAGMAIHEMDFECEGSILQGFMPSSLCLVRLNLANLDYSMTAIRRLVSSLLPGHELVSMNFLHQLSQVNHTQQRELQLEEDTLVDISRHAVDRWVFKGLQASRCKTGY
ncbi:hypothetical protein D9758_005508 [Tetrapyrgos nigripes]|uniref:Uncharacterized protein n=1 Tax=Tetrapyrgos nigripes TaxID=182062 RepID=A0A8H5LPE6_9AGAR|nr:hypothetical protein D9758_005508 [Tetrapyrgos nigripes]